MKIMLEQEKRYALHNRYLFEGKLLMKTALHIGGNKFTLSHSNSPVVLTPTGMPFIPGSSFKGALRSTVEKLVPGLPGFSSCALIDLSDEKDQIVSVEKGKQGKWPVGVCPTSWQEELTRRRRKATSPKQEEAIMQEALDNLCNTCRLFGSPFAASRINISDLYLPEGEWAAGIQVRDGVAIDRDSEKARDRLKYDFEVVPASTEFDLRIVLENATPQDLLLVSVGLSEFVQGFGGIGGKRSRGLGVCELHDLTVSSLELDDPKLSESERSRQLANYLIKREFSAKESGDKFFSRQIEKLFQ
jgi:CRISPR-associated protein Csm3